MLTIELVLIMLPPCSLICSAAALQPLNTAVTLRFHYLLERFGVVLRQWLASGYSGVVYQDIKLAESGSDLIYCVFIAE